MLPTIETERLKLVPPRIDCFSAYERFYTDEVASKMYGGPINKEQVWARLKADLGSWHLLGFGVWVIQLKSNNNYIGTCGFWQGKDWPRELTWWVIPEGRGRGIATEASKAALSYAYDEFKWDIVETYMNDENIAARALVEKLGGRKDRREMFNDGFSRDIYVLPKPD
ncbi:N-acetyltransferase [Microbulbifer sp. A4B17]|uniref:GNAT family N-acetyltransferase n=1 Tax=Microbulbifer sp. A4B17 TaxID=359370 RepID=UPI000D52DFD9|nr:GNAT family N-acetyltransferase [Microbulbifer sp. A4B17]AWF83441.1 N-acetyltransferase [Microbulbifer sp. A4B17]